MQSKTSNSATAPQRCQHHTPGGRQCCSPVAAPGATLCARHASVQPPEFVDFSRELIDRYGDFQTAQQMNHSLIALYKLVAQGRMSPRQGAVLGYLGSLVLRSLKSIDYDNDRFPEEREKQTPHAAPKAQTLKGDAVTERNAVGPGKEPLPATAQEFAAQALNRKPN
jgi:hypothetical protein